MAHCARSFLALSMLLAAPLAGCLSAEEPSTGSASVAEEPEEPAPRLSCTNDQEPEVVCPNKTGKDAVSSATCPADLYFHPNNGLHGGWIEAWRLCNEGGQNYRICTGGYAPVRYWNPSSCNGTVQDYYPQGWSGWSQTGGGCC